MSDTGSAIMVFVALVALAVGVFVVIVVLVALLMHSLASQVAIRSVRFRRTDRPGP